MNSIVCMNSDVRMNSIVCINSDVRMNSIVCMNSDVHMNSIVCMNKVVHMNRYCMVRPDKILSKEAGTWNTSLSWESYQLSMYCLKKILSMETGVCLCHIVFPGNFLSCTACACYSVRWYFVESYIVKR